MSLKAKLEAVIYASEEPVTLAQLIGLLGEEGQAELDVLAANQLTLDTPAEDEDSALDLDNLNAEVLDTTEVESAEAESTETTTSDLSSRPESASFADAAERPAGEPATDPGPDFPQTPVILSEGSEPHPEPQSKDPETLGPDSTPGSISTPEPAEPTAKLIAAEQKLATRRLRDYFRALLDQLIADYANSDRGLEVKEVASGFRFATKPEYHDAVRGFVKSLKPPLKLSLQALETLAVVAYKQPVTSPEVSEIRGVESAGTLGSLLTRKLVTTAGRKQVIGRPILYKTTKDFLLRFGLKDINELPSIEEFEKMAGELNEAVQEEIDMEEESNQHTDPAQHPAVALSQTSVILSEGSELHPEPQPKDPETLSPDTEPVNPSDPAPTTEVSSRPESSQSEVEVERPAVDPAIEPTPDSSPLDERNAVPTPTHQLHDTLEDLMSDRSTSPEGHKHEPTDA